MSRTLDIVEFPRTKNDDLNYVEYYKYLAIVEDLDDKTASTFNNHLRKVFNSERRNGNVQTC